MEINKLISVIVPAYNCEETLENAIEEAENKHGSDRTEILIIDDGSGDFTPQVIEELEKKYKNVRSVRTENQGPAMARNTGIRMAQGEYIMFLDSDDLYEKDIFSKVITSLSESPDLVIFGFRQTFAGRASDKIYSYEGSTDIDALYGGNLLNQVWNKAYKKQFLTDNNILFSDYRYGEDRLFIADALKCNPTIKVIPDVLYNYRIDNSTSLISGYTKGKFEACKKIYEEFSKLCSDESVPRYMFLKNILSCLTVLYADNCTLSDGEKQNEAERILSDDIVRKAMSEKCGGTYAELIRKIINTGNPKLNLRFAKTVSICQKKFLPLFLKFRG